MLILKSNTILIGHILPDVTFCFEQRYVKVILASVGRTFIFAIFYIIYYRYHY